MGLPWGFPLVPKDPPKISGHSDPTPPTVGVPIECPSRSLPPESRSNLSLRPPQHPQPPNTCSRPRLTGALDFAFGAIGLELTVHRVLTAPLIVCLVCIRWLRTRRPRCLLFLPRAISGSCCWHGFGCRSPVKIFLPDRYTWPLPWITLGFVMFRLLYRRSRMPMALRPRWALV